MTTYQIRFCIALLLAVALAACQGQVPESEQQQEQEQEQPAEAGQSEPVESDNGGEEIAEGELMTENDDDQLNLEQAIDTATQDLAGRSDVSADAISVVAARQVTWANGALGCPEEGMMYTQALVDGYYIRLSDGENEHAYHAGRDGQPFYCPADRSKAPLDSDQDKPLS